MSLILQDSPGDSPAPTGAENSALTMDTLADTTTNIGNYSSKYLFNHLNNK